MEKIYSIYLVGYYGDPDSIENFCSSEEIADEYIRLKRLFIRILKYKRRIN